MIQMCACARIVMYEELWERQTRPTCTLKTQFVLQTPHAARRTPHATDYIGGLDDMGGCKLDIVH